MNKLLKKEEVAQIIGKGPRAVQEMAKRGEIEATNIGFSDIKPRFRFTAEAIENWIRRNTIKPLRVK